MLSIIYSEQDLFDLSYKYTLAHCISADCALGAGIAVEFNKRFNMREHLILRCQFRDDTRAGDIAVIAGIVNLVTKNKCWEKPTKENFSASLEKFRDYVIKHNISKIGIPLIGCGLDGLKWGFVDCELHRLFADIGKDLEIVVCYLEKDKHVLQEAGVLDRG